MGTVDVCSPPQLMTMHSYDADENECYSETLDFYNRRGLRNMLSIECCVWRCGSPAIMPQLLGGHGRQLVDGVVESRVRNSMPLKTFRVEGSLNVSFHWRVGNTLSGDEVRRCFRVRRRLKSNQSPPGIMGIYGNGPQSHFVETKGDMSSAIFQNESFAEK
ncbi:hypothetical protein TNCV_3605151 [Trichonephila clavipes]|uniref:Uncharacterized protein n=1 Tax=Trichonephila clavipes TaxID=2585209 RepID=A0A8X6UW58_TRICX|nr:hypothetical protein TNCV_3605151 [Trichonephila clavipes]